MGSGTASFTLPPRQKSTKANTSVLRWVSGKEEDYIKDKSEKVCLLDVGPTMPGGGKLVCRLFLQINLCWSTATSAYLYIAHRGLPTATEKLNGDNRHLQSLEYLLSGPLQKTLASSWTKQVRATFFHLRTQGALPTGSWQWRGLCIQNWSPGASLVAQLVKNLPTVQNWSPKGSGKS